MPYFEGDIIARARYGVSKAANAKLDAGTLGRICAVVTPGAAYLVRFEGVSNCVLQYEDSLVPAVGPAPSCLDHPTCKAT